MSIPSIRRAALLGLTLLPALLGAQPSRPRPDEAGDPQVQRLLTEGVASSDSGNMAGARERYRAALERARTVGDSAGIGVAGHRLGFVYWQASQYDSALGVLFQARTAQERHADAIVQALTYNTIGASYFQLGLYEPALEAYLQAAQRRRELGDSLGLARTLTNIGRTSRDWRQFDQARSYLQEAIAIAKTHPDGAAILGYALNSLATVAIDTRRLDEARTLIAESKAAYARSTTTRTAADSSDVFEINALATGRLLMAEGRYAAAQQFIDSVVASTTRRASVRGRSEALVVSAMNRQQLGDPTRARRDAEAAITSGRTINQRVTVMQALELLGELVDERRDPVVALRTLREYHALRDSVFDQEAGVRIASREAREEAERSRRLAELQQFQLDRQRSWFAFGGVILLLAGALVVVLLRQRRLDRERSASLKTSNAELAAVNEELRQALTEVQALSGLIPICAHCKQMRDDQGYWRSVENYLTERSTAKFSHSICQSCGPELYGDLWEEVMKGQQP